tara:strand:+ start:9694 stop:10122 length:429 start_codon:yes stop_codon:yes gene_type:complete
MIKQFSSYGYSVSTADVAIGTGYTAFPITALAANQKSFTVPDDCFLESVEFELSSIAASDTVTLFIARDSAGLVPITSDALSGATQTVTLSVGASTTGGVSFTINKDYHFDTVVGNATSGTIYVCAKANAACVANIRLNWRA